MPNYKKTFVARVSRNVLLSAGTDEKETRHIELEADFDEGVEAYVEGDVLSVWPKVNQSYVEKIISAWNFSTDEMIGEGEKAKPLSKVLNSYELGGLIGGGNSGRSTIRKLLSLIERHSSQSKVELPKNILDYAFYDLPKLFPELKLVSSKELLEFLPRLKPRLYSIASSASIVNNEVHLTVVRHRIQAPDGTRRFGLASNCICDLCVGDEVRCFLTPKKSFRLPENDTYPIIMVGAGTGIAPFRGFMQKRSNAQKTTSELANWLFFGEIHEESCFFYKDELLAWEADGMLRLDTAWSRDGDHKVYVFHKLQEKASDVWYWLNDRNAILYLCGDSERMAPAVLETIDKISLDRGGANEYSKVLKSEKRLREDVY